MVPAEAGVGRSLVVVIVDVAVLDYPREQGPVKLLPPQQVHLLQLTHPLHQGHRPVDRLRVPSQRFHEAPLGVRVLLLLGEEFLELVGSGLGDELGLVAEARGGGGDAVVAGTPADSGVAH